jgi:hypothetical protein
MGERGTKLEPAGAKVVTGKSRKNKRGYPKWHDVAAGAAAGAGARLLTAPLDLIKIRRQVLHTSSTSVPVSMLETAKNVVQNEGGIRALFRGNVAATYLWVGYAIVQFSLYGRMNDYLSSSTPSFLVPSQVTDNLALQPPKRHLDFRERIRKPLQAWDELRCDISKRQTTVAFISGATAGVWYVQACKFRFPCRGRIRHTCPKSLTPYRSQRFSPPRLAPLWLLTPSTLVAQPLLRKDSRNPPWRMQQVRRPVQHHLRP